MLGRLLLALVLTASLAASLAVPASAKRYSVSVPQPSGQTGPVFKVSVNLPRGWKVVVAKDRSMLTTYRIISRRCAIVADITGYEARDQTSTTPTARSYVDSWNQKVASPKAVGAGTLTGPPSVQGLAFDTAGAWGVVEGHTLSNQPAYVGAAGYVATERIDNSYYRQLGVTGKLTQAVTKKCKTSQIRARRKVLGDILKSAILR